MYAIVACAFSTYPLNSVVDWLVSVYTFSFNFRWVQLDWTRNWRQKHHCIVHFVIQFLWTKMNKKKHLFDTNKHTCAHFVCVQISFFFLVSFWLTTKITLNDLSFILHFRYVCARTHTYKVFDRSKVSYCHCFFIYPYEPYSGYTHSISIWMMRVQSKSPCFNL